MNNEPGATLNVSNEAIDHCRSRFSDLKSLVSHSSPTDERIPLKLENAMDMAEAGLDRLSMFRSQQATAAELRARRSGIIGRHIIGAMRNCGYHAAAQAVCGRAQDTCTTASARSVH